MKIGTEGSVWSVGGPRHCWPACRLVGGSTLAVVDRKCSPTEISKTVSSCPRLRAVGQGWGCFTNGGSAAYGFYDDQWAPVVADGRTQPTDRDSTPSSTPHPSRIASPASTRPLP